MQGQPESNFNPLPRKEGDALEEIVKISENISIHSLVKRETNWLVVIINPADNFNPLPRKEGDVK